jgi:predicted negative regulator of RcsB-dependent stress response
MISEERHELQNNDLESWLQYGLWLWLKNNASYIVLVLALCLLGWNLWNWYERKQIDQAQKAWQELQATDQPGVENKPIKLQAIIDTYDSRPIRALALRALGNSYLDSVAAGVNLNEGANPAAATPVDTKDALNRAQAAFERIINEFPEQTLALGSAKLGLAAIAEDRGEWDSAKKQYEAIADKSGPFANTAFATIATTRLGELDKFKNAPRLAELAPPPAPASQPAKGLSIDPLQLEPATPATPKPTLPPSPGATTPGTSGTSPQTAPSPAAAPSPASATQPAK